MTTFDTPAKATAASGASATERFHTDKSPFEVVKDTPSKGAMLFDVRITN
jgi:catechol 1,2-dioxygenase